MSDSSDTIRILRETLELERAATSRYAEHQSWAGDPRLCAYWEGLRRNEADHHSAILAELARTGVAKPDDEAAPGDPPGVQTAAVADPPPDPGAPLRERGFARLLATLRSDVEFERLAVEKYATFAKQLGDPRLKALMRELVRAETGHGRGLSRTIERVSATDYAVVIYCPACGWELDFGTNPAERATVHCPMCAMNFALRARDGDFVLERV
jgi:rubrerythrin